MNRNNRQQNNSRYSQQSHSPVSIKISKKILYLILTVSIISTIMSSICVAVSIMTPMTVTKNLKIVQAQMNEIIKLWQAGGVVNSSNVSQGSTDTQEEPTEKAPSLSDNYVQEELRLIGNAILEELKNEDIKKAILELDASTLSVKGVVSNIQMSSVNSAIGSLDRIKSSNRYITKMFIGTKRENFISSPEMSMVVDYKPSETTWYKLATTKDSIVWGQVQQDEFTKEYIITGSVAVKDKDRLIGVVGVQVSLSKMG